MSDYELSILIGLVLFTWQTYCLYEQLNVKKTFIKALFVVFTMATVAVVYAKLILGV